MLYVCLTRGTNLVINCVELYFGNTSYFIIMDLFNHELQVLSYLCLNHISPVKPHLCHQVKNIHRIFSCFDLLQQTVNCYERPRTANTRTEIKKKININNIKTVKHEINKKKHTQTACSVRQTRQLNTTAASEDRRVVSQI